MSISTLATQHIKTTKKNTLIQPISWLYPVLLPPLLVDYAQFFNSLFYTCKERPREEVRDMKGAIGQEEEGKA